MPNLTPGETSAVLGPVAVKNNYADGGFPIYYYIDVWVWTNENNFNYYRIYTYKKLKEPPSVLNLIYADDKLELVE